MTRRDTLLRIGLASIVDRLLRAGDVADRTVVLSFDDAPSTHATFVGPLLRKYGFPATFFVCEFPPDFEDKHKYMSWEQIRGLYDMGFEIGSHTRTHRHVNKMTPDQFDGELAYIEQRCRENGIPKPISFAYPGYDTSPAALPVLKNRGYRFARAGGDRPYDPKKDDPLLIPSYTIRGSETQPAIDVMDKAHDGQIVVLTFHGIPDYAHSWVTTTPELFEACMEHLKKEKYHVLSVRDLSKYTVTETA